MTMPTRVLVLLDKSAPNRPSCSAHFFGCTHRAAPDFERRLHDAVAEWLATMEGQCVRAQIGEARFDWGHAIDGVPPELWRKHGLALRQGFFDPSETLIVDYQPLMPVAGEGDPESAGSLPSAQPTQLSQGQASASTDVILRVPRQAWERLEETRALDAQSHLSEPELRERITAALDQVETVDRPMVIIAVRGGVAEIESASDEVEVSIVDHDNLEALDGN